MEIPRDFRPPEPPARRRGVDAARVGEAARATEGAPAGSDEALGSNITRLVDAIKDLAPARLHRVEDLRQRIINGTYTASPDELAGPLADLLGDGGG